MSKSNAFALLDGDDEDVEAKYAGSRARSNVQDKTAPAKATAGKAPARPPALVGGSRAGSSGAGSSGTVVANGGAPQRRENNNVGNVGRNHGNNRRPDFNDREAFRKSFQRVIIESTGTVVLRLHETDIVKVWPNGDVILNTGTWFTAKTMASMNDALWHFDMEVEVVNHPVTKGDWKVYDGHSKHYRFADNMKVPAVVDADRGRAAKLLEEYGMAVPAFLRPRPVQQPAPAAQQHSPGLGAAAGLAIGAPAANGWAAVAAPPVQPAVPQMRPANVAPPTAFHALPAAVPAAHTAAHAAHVEAVTQQLAHLEAAGTGAHLAGVPEDDICLVCFEALRTVVLIPCGHLVLCDGCFNDILMTKAPAERLCPMCRDTVTDHLLTD